MKLFGGLMLTAFAGGVLFAAAACGGSTTKNADSSSTASQQSIDALTSRVQQDELLNAWVTLSALPLHDQDTSVQNGTIDGKYVPTLRTLIRVLALTPWPSDLQADATAFHDEAVTLFKDLNAGKTADQVKAQSSALHDHFHEFTPKVGDEAAKDLPADAGGPEGSHDNSSTPMAGMTPAATAAH